MLLTEFTDTAVTSRELRLLDLEPAHVATYAELPPHHRDPFERLLVAQSKAENLAVLTSEEPFSAYGVETHW